ncbi:MAG: FkbM family methyltransferase [Nitrospirales bacterium]|nr:FkbM family methyltransferase [Nitrospirales bacterium]NKB82253.1 FkbM family methyltransferase [Nitrospirales bacterium]
MTIARKKEELTKFGKARTASFVKSNFSNQVGSEKTHLKLLIIDATKIGDGTATGEMKKNLLGEWPKEKLLQIYSVAYEKIGMYRGTSTEGYPVEANKIHDDVKQYNPDVILYRPVPDNMALHNLAMKLILQANKPFVTWIMDDWPARLNREDYNKYLKMEQDYRVLLARSQLNLSISQAMSHALKERYGVTFMPLANGVNLKQWPRKEICTQKSKTFLVRYAGSLAENMTLQSLARVARAIEEMSENYEIKFEIRTKKIWWDKAKQYFRGLKRTFFLVDQLSSEDYRAWISEADMLVIAYNYDPISIEYIQYSFANKLPECLASGAVILAHGPTRVATIDYLKSNGCAAIVEDDSEASLIQEMEKVITDNSYRVGLVEKARMIASKNHDLMKLQEKMETLFVQISQSRALDSHVGFLTMDREVHAHLDETKIIARLLSALPVSSIMIDVGAHHGTALAPFSEMGWKVFAFEPDPGNRKRLVERYGNVQNISIDPRAVGERTETGVPFYVSDESTGISSMLAFRENHKPGDAVDVTTIAGILADNDIEHVNFLKIDVEGYDFSVLKSVPWGEIKPDVIECEFEDEKTKHLGHSWKDICEYLVEKGYAVYVSEWHPIIRYGIRHDWHQLIRYPCELADSNAWGNLLAFKNDPGCAAMQEALDKVLTVKHSACQSLGTSERIMKQPFLPCFSSYAHFVEWVRSKSLTLFRIGQFAMWVLYFLKRHPTASALGLMTLSMLVLMPILIPAFAFYESYFWAVAVLCMFAAISGMGISFVNKKIMEFVEREHHHRQALKFEIICEHEKKHDQLVSRVKAQRQQLEQLVLGKGGQKRQPEQQPEQLAQYMELVNSIPTRSPIFLPTEKVPLPERIRSLKRVSQIYNDQLDALYRPQIRALREKYKGTDRCFIIGNGPSLNSTDLSVLKNEVTFAVNGFFMKVPELDWLPTFYVVEDHLVAEDRQERINNFSGPTKLFPVYLGYCLDGGCDTIFFNHRPRVSYPHGFDFSTDASEITYAGCTVTYTCMQLAYYFGFKAIYLIGVDASYDIPNDVNRSNAYDVSVLDMQSDDPNHFHPDYFGKGFRWHNPQVDKMLEAYLEAKRVLEKTEQNIFNATIGGKLEVFKRVKFSSIFPKALSPKEVERLNIDNNGGSKNSV